MRLQSDVEKLEGLPVTPFMDRDKVTKPSSQTGFIQFVLLPLFMELANLFPCLEVNVSPSVTPLSLWCLNRFSSVQQHIIHPVRKALDYYTEMEKAVERESQSWAKDAKDAKDTKEAAADGHSAAFNIHND